MDKKIRPFIVPIFISNQGCPHRCIFCDQKRITGEHKIGAEDVKRIIDMAMNSKRFKKEDGMEVAFYGGTFTNLPIQYMKELLSGLKEYMHKGIIKKIRVSTRPDSVNKSVLDMMKDYNVRTVELGAQSLDNNVLRLSKRGHSAEDTIKAAFLLKKEGFQLGIQLMPGLPGDSKEVFMDTVKKVLSLKPDMVRLYPTLVIKGTGLEQLYKKGHYKPLGLDEAIEICTDAVILFEKKDIPVIRIGLMNSGSLIKNIVAGPWHPAFGFLVRSRAFIKKEVIPLLRHIRKGSINIFTIPNSIPLLRGYKNAGLRMIEMETGIKVCNVFPDPSLYYPDIIRVEEA